MPGSQRKDIFRLEEFGIAYSFGLLRGASKMFLKKLESINRELNANYFETKIRNIKPIIQLVEGLKVTVTLLLTGTVFSLF